MNKRELIERMEGLKNLFGNKPEYVETDTVIKLISQLDEPKQVTVPIFVADYIEFKKENNFHVYGAMRVIEDHHDKRVPEWFYEGNIEKFCLAWLFGYEVEKEPKYIVKIKGVGFMSFLNHDLQSDLWSINNVDNGKIFKTHHTRKELEDAGFGWVFDCEGIEVEEVEE